jgi:uncharacterized protein YqeY
MTLEALQKEMIAAMKSGDKARKDVLSGLVGAVKKAGIDNMCKDNIPEELVDTVLLKEKKTVQEQIDTCPTDRVDNMEKFQFAMSVINEFAPSLMSDATEIENFVRGLGIELTKANRGTIMKALKGKADMKIANGVISSLLA